MRVRHVFFMLVAVGLGSIVLGCRREARPAQDAPPTEEAGPALLGVWTLRSYRWTTDLRADSSLFDQSHAPAPLRVGPFVLKGHVTGERITPDREHSRTVVEPVTIEPRESITVGSQRWNRIGEGPWRVGEEAFPAARAFFGGTATLSARAILEPGETSAVTQLRKEMAAMPYVEEAAPTGTARRYTLRPDQVATVVNDASLNPFPVLKTLPNVRIDIWVDRQRGVGVGLRVVADSPTASEAFVLEIRVTEIEPAGLTIEPPR